MAFRYARSLDGRLSGTWRRSICGAGSCRPVVRACTERSEPTRGRSWLDARAFCSAGYRSDARPKPAGTPRGTSVPRRCRAADLRRARVGQFGLVRRAAGSGRCSSAAAVTESGTRHRTWVFRIQSPTPSRLGLPGVRDRGFVESPPHSFAEMPFSRDVLHFASSSVPDHYREARARAVRDTQPGTRSSSSSHASDETSIS